jgi:hypothetical protein
MIRHREGDKMMNLYFIESLIKERQQEIERDFKRIHLSQAVRNSGPGIFKKSILGLRNVLIAGGTRLQKHFRPSVNSGISGHDCCST